jgi:hypothetical protein
MTLALLDNSLKGMIYGWHLKTGASDDSVQALYRQGMDALEQAIRHSEETYIQKHQLENGYGEMLYDLFAIGWMNEQEEDDAVWPGVLDERGTELLDLLMYLLDCVEEGKKPSITDFLEMVSESELFGESDDMDFFMPLYQMQDAIEEGTEAFKLIIEDENDPRLKEPDILPIALFFSQVGKTEKAREILLAKSDADGYQAAFYFAISSFYTDAAILPDSFTELI